MTYDNYTCFEASRQGRVLTLTMNRPDELNAVNKDMHDELGSIFYDAQLDDDADVIVLTGAGTVQFPQDDGGDADNDGKGGQADNIHGAAGLLLRP